MGNLVVATILSAVCLAFFALAVRLFRQADGESGRAERLIGVFFAAVGVEVLTYVFSTAAAGPAVGVAVAVSSCALLAFVRTVFRPAEGWARGLAWTLGVAIPAVFIGPFFVGGPTAEMRILWSVFRSTALLWAFAECALYHARMRRQLAIGLADPIVANRFLLWSFWTAGTAVLPISGLVLRLLARAGLVEDYTVTREPGLGVILFACVIFSGLAISAVSLWLSFTPPAAYKRWVTRRAAPAT